MGAGERVLRHFLRIGRVGEQSQRDRVEPVLVAAHERFKGGVHVARKRLDQGRIVHRNLKPVIAANGCMPAGRRPGNRGRSVE